MSHTRRTVKITVRGEPRLVDAVIQQMQEFLQITFLGRAQRLTLNQNHVQRTLRAAPLFISVDEEPSDPPAA